MSVALVTGAGRGIGREVAAQLLSRGWAVALGCRRPDRVEAELGGGDGESLVVELDVTDPPSIEAAATLIADRYGRVDALINNAAIMYDTWARAETVDIEDVHVALETNLFGAWRATQAFLPLLRRSGHGRIVNVSSESGSISGMGGGAPAYSISKAALNALTRQLAADLRRDRILVNAVCPGWTDTDMGRGGRPVSAGAASVVWAVELPDDGPTGGFFRDGRPLPW
jgi:NAD(P)-dependent dehydrogenase (short-subunit alcohol dehydrogenase family)